VASRLTCNCQATRCQFSTEGIIAVDEKFELRILCRSEARVSEVQVYYATHLPTASTLAECLHEVGNLFFQLAFFCECTGSGAPIFPRGSDVVIPADEIAYFLSLARDRIGLRRHINQNIINRIRHPVERHCHLEYVYILSSSLDDMVKIGVSRDHPERRLSGITQCYPDAVLVAYTVRIPYAYRVEQLAHAELALRRVDSPRGLASHGVRGSHLFGWGGGRSSLVWSCAVMVLGSRSPWGYLEKNKSSFRHGPGESESLGVLGEEQK
jgi:T5orf172 domain